MQGGTASGVTPESRAVANAGLDVQASTGVSALSPVAAIASEQQSAAAPAGFAPSVQGVGEGAAAQVPDTGAVSTMEKLEAVNDDDGSRSLQMYALEALIRLIFAPIIVFLESIVSLAKPPLGSKVLGGLAIFSSLCWLSLIIYMGATSFDGDRTGEQHAVHVVLCGAMAFCTLGIHAVVVDRRLWNPRSYVIRNPEELSSIPFLFAIWVRVMFEGAQFAALPILFVPLSKARFGNDDSPVGAMADEEASRYRIVNGLLLRSFSENGWWSTDDGNTGFNPRYPVNETEDVFGNLTATVERIEADAKSHEVAFDLYWPLAVLAIWVVCMSLNGMLRRRRAHTTCPTMFPSLPGLARPQPVQQWLLSERFYRGVLLLQNQLFDINGPFAIMLLMAASEFLIVGYNRNPGDVTAMSAKSYQTLGVFFGCATLTTFYLQPRAVSSDVYHVDCVESPIYSSLRGLIKALTVCGVMMIAHAGDHSETDNVVVRAVVIAIVTGAAHFLLGILTLTLRPTPRDFINGTQFVLHLGGVFMSIIVIVLSTSDTEKMAAEATGSLLIVAGIIIFGIIVAFIVRTGCIKRVLPGDAETTSAEQRRRIVSGLRLYTATMADDVALCSSRTVSQILWRPMESFLLASSNSDGTNRDFVIKLLHTSFIPANVGAPAPWTQAILIALQRLAPDLPQDTVLQGIAFTQHVIQATASIDDNNAAVLLEAAMTRCTLLHHLSEPAWVLAFKSRSASISNSVTIDGNSANTQAPLLAQFPTVELGHSQERQTRLEALCAMATGLRMEAEALSFFATSTKATSLLPMHIMEATIGHFYEALEVCAVVFIASADEVYDKASAHSKRCLICVREAWLDAHACLHDTDGGAGMGRGAFGSRSLLREYKLWHGKRR